MSMFKKTPLINTIADTSVDEMSRCGASRVRGWILGFAWMGMGFCFVTSTACRSNSDVTAKSQSHSDLSKAEQAELRKAMNGFLSSLEARDTSAFLGYFSKVKPWSYRSTIGQPSNRQSYRYEDLKKGLSKELVDGEHQGFYQSFFDGDGMDCFRDHVVQAPRDWTLLPDTKFVPPQSKSPYLVYIAWQKTDSGWFVREIAEPAA